MLKISACVIVRNEEKNLPRWLACMTTLADEMVVVDTGSTDNTVELARQAGAKICSFPWINDFAAAKNYAIEQAQGKWLFFLDADEYIKVQDYAAVRAAIRQYDREKKVIGLVNPLINIDPHNDNAYISTIYQIRLFRKLPDLRYVGAIHEMLRYTGGDKKNMPLVDTYAIYHTGYAPQVMPEKYKRNLQMLTLSQKKYGKRLIDDFYLADCYYGLQQYEQAVSHAQAYLEATERIAGEESRPYGVLLQSMIFLDYPLGEILDWVDKALAEFPYGAEFKILAGYAREAAGDIDGALQCFSEADSLYAKAKARGGPLHADEAGGALPAMHLRRQKLLQQQQNIQKKEMGEGKQMPYISACVIVRNEEKNLPRWLTCMSALAEEMVVVDTGSTDNTVEIARQAGAKIYSFPWINDFAAAKNYALEQARGKWIFFLDADEYWKEHDFAIIRKTLRQYDKVKKVIGFVCRLVNIDVDNNNRVLNENLHIRIFRNLPQLRYIGAIHEQLVYNGLGQREMKLLPEAVIYHTGYSASTDIPKAKRNLQIMLEQQQAGRGQDSDICYITDCYYSLQDYARAIEAAREAIARKVVLPGRETRMYCTLLQSLHITGHKWQELVPIVEQAEHEFPHVPDFRALLGFAAWQDGAKEQARQFFQESKALYQEFLAHRQDLTATFADEMQGFLPKMDACLTEDNFTQDKASSKIKLSAAVIVKNGEADIGTWISCVQDLAEEIVVVDTGSTDRTVEIAANAGIRVVHFDWIDDFAAAKNFAIEQVHGEWVLLMDADEYIPQEYYEGFKNALNRYDEDESVIGLCSEWINVDKVRNNAYISKGYQVRLFRNLPELRYVHMIHELLCYSGKDKKLMPYVQDFKIYHTGYSTGRMPEKYSRNLRLLLLSEQKYGRRAEDNMYLAECYYGMHDYEKAIEHAKAYLDGDGRTIGGENRPYSIWIKSLIQLEKSLAEILLVVKRALQEFPYSAEFKVLEGVARQRAQDYAGTEVCYREALQIYAAGQAGNELQKELLTDEASATFVGVYLELCKLLLWQEKNAEAWEYLQKALVENKYNPMCVQLLGKFMAADEDVIWIEVLNKLYDREKDAAFIMENLPVGQRDKVRLYYMEKLPQQRLVDKFMLAGRLEAASAALAEDTAALLQLGIRGFTHDAGTMDKLGVLFPQKYQAVALGKSRTAEERRLAAKTARIQKWLTNYDGQAE
ncbi:tetratricopeptide repeat-containing glycosyltransferase family 2 protein [Selenomonas ruminantium]|uniref:Glycosyltransferase involved in cell wall bisynthesis n=1 Tax=Selenomonas ruminantium TaxID=971 RepID=A0A1H3ZIG6_SELRU|nr:glycosyltransferase family 2 protein [Selenomonas ruminantium]SEA23074.1 Glycosyltransferase involved in cell wall bisynthesis [Selenomonas ruminantium]